MTNKKKIRVFMVFCCVMMFAFSLSSSMYSSLAPFIITHYGMTLTESSLITISSSIGNLLINLVIIRLADRFDKGHLLAVLCGMGIYGLWIALAADECVRGILMIIRWKSGAWKTKRVVKEPDREEVPKDPVLY